MDDEFLREQFRESGYNVSKLARSLGLDYTETKRRFEPDETPARRPTGPRPQNIRDLARFEWLRPYVIAVKPANGNWPDEFAKAIYKAKKRFDGGTHIMCQTTGSDGWVVLYLIPRKQPRRPQAYFFLPREGL
jgi:hypothetical protein